MARPQIREVSEAAEIRGIANPVNTYVRPETPAPSSLHSLAEGLAAFDSGLQNFLGKRKAENDELDKIRGQAAFNTSNQVGWAEAVASGAVPANASPYFMQSYKEAQGNLQGIQLRKKFNDAYLNWEGRNSEDPAAFDAFLGEFIKNNVSEQDPYVLKGLNPHLEGLTIDGYDTHGKERSRAAYNGSVNTRSAIIGETIDHASQQGNISEDGTNYGLLKSSILEQREEALSSGVLQADFDDQLVATIVAKAVENEDPALLEILDDILPGYEVKLSSLPQYRDAKSRALELIDKTAEARMTAQDKAQQKIDIQRENLIVTGVMRTLSENPNTEIPEEIIREWEKYDPTARTKINTARKNLSEGHTLESQDDLLQIERMIHEGATVQDILKLSADGVIKDPSTLRTAIDRADRRAKALREGTGILTTQTAKRLLGTIKQRTTPDTITGLFAPEGLSDEGLEATREFEEMILDWEKNNPNATQLEREKATNDIGELILKRINPDERTYLSTDDAAKLREETKSKESPDASTTGSTTSPSGPSGRSRSNVEAKGDRVTKTVRPYTADQPPKVLDLSPDQQEQIKNNSKKLGITPEEYNLKLWKKLKEKISNTSNPISDGLDGVITAYTEKTSIEPQHHLLDFIGNAEGTDKGRGYNETLGYGKFTDGDHNLVEMTLGEIDALQTVMLRHPENNLNSSALGRYQIVQKTLRGLKKQMGLTDDMKFTPELQDAMARRLLDSRGYQKWKSGEITDQQFMANLSKEWSSLPQANGLSYHDSKRTKATPNHMREVFSKVLNRDGGASAEPSKNALTSTLGRGIKTNSDMNPILNTAQGDASPYTRKGANEKLSNLIAGPLAEAQRIFGKEIIINDAIPKKGTTRVKDTPDSRHFHGDAVDISTKGMTNAEKLALFRALKQAGFTGFGFGETIIHADLGKKRAWAYKNKKFAGRGIAALIKEAKT